MNLIKHQAKFDAHVYKVFDDVVAMIDCKKGMSLTNSINYWINLICQKEGFAPQTKKWIYRDSLDIWDGYDPINKTFISLSTTDFLEALQMIRGEKFRQILGRESI